MQQKMVQIVSSSPAECVIRTQTLWHEVECWKRRVGLWVTTIVLHYHQDIRDHCFPALLQVSVHAQVHGGQLCPHGGPSC